MKTTDRTGRIMIAAIALLLCLCAAEAGAQQVRIKDITKIQGMRDNQLSGVGIVTGLNNTGDGSPATRQALVNLLRKQNLNISASAVASGNVALVLVVATLPPYAREGNKIDVSVSSIGDAESLFGGTLIQAPLTAATGDVYAVAQGPISIGGFSASGAAASVTKNHTTVGTIPAGAIIEREVDMKIVNPHDQTLLFTLNNPDFTTARRIAEVVNGLFKNAALAQDMKGVEIKIPKGFDDNDLVGFVADIQSLTVTPDTLSKVIISERTGTIVAGSDVRISTVAITHGSLTISIAETQEASQPGPFARVGETAILDRTAVEAKEDLSNFVVIENNSSVADLAQALNSIGATPRDLVVIFQLMKKAGALHAALELM